MIFKRLPFEAFLVSLVMIVHILVALAPANSLLNWYQTDDAFYYFKTAQNISEGYGVTFDRLSRASGFRPLWMAVCVPIFALARFDLILPLRLLVLLSAAITAATAVLIYRLLRRVVSPPASSLAAFLWAFYPGIHSVTTQLGMEAGINAFFVMLLLTLVTSNREPTRYSTLWIGFAAAGAVMSRLDNIFVLAVFGAWYLLRRFSLRPWIFLDGIFLIFTNFASFFLRVPAGSYFMYIPSAEWMLGLGLAIKPLALLLVGLYRPPQRVGWKSLILRTLLALAAAESAIALGMLALTRLGVFSDFPRSVLVLDLGLSILLLGGLRVFTRWRNLWREPEQAEQLSISEALVYGAPTALLLGGYMLWSHFYFGTFSPVSGQIKHWWSTLWAGIYGRPVDNLWGFLGFPPRGGGPWSLLTDLVRMPAAWFAADNEALEAGLTLVSSLLLAAALLLAVYWSRRVLAGAFQRAGLLPLFAACFVQSSYYFGTGYVNTRPWYWTGQMLLLVLLAGVLLEGIVQLLSRRAAWTKPVLQLPVSRAETGLVVFGLLVFIVFTVKLFTWIPLRVAADEREDYLWGVREVEKFTEPGSLVGSTGGGVIAYFIQDRTIVNLDGLMNSVEYFLLLKSGKAATYLDRIGLDYVYGGNYVIEYTDPYKDLFADRLVKIGYVGGSYLYKYEAR